MVDRGVNLRCEVLDRSPVDRAGVMTSGMVRVFELFELAVDTASSIFVFGALRDGVAFRAAV